MSGLNHHLRRMSSSDIMRGLNTKETEGVVQTDELWQRLHSSILGIFKARVDSPLPDVNIALLNETCRRLIRSDSKNTIFSRVEDALLKQCFLCIQESILQEPEKTFLDSLALWWTRFFQKILPLVCMIFTPVPTYGLTIRQMCLKIFRDAVLCKVLHRLKDSLGHEDGIPIEVVQMLLVVQSVPETSTEGYRQTEEMSGLLIRPYLQNMKAIGEQLEQEFSGSTEGCAGVAPHSAVLKRTSGNSLSGVSMMEYSATQKPLERETSTKLGPVNESGAVF